ncbi:MAG: endopeptidase La [Chloroflexi bacterium]|nr:endopeptidase La [Chloroflexota bacterium]
MTTHEISESRRTKPGLPRELPVIPSGDNILFPFLIAPISAADEATIRLIDAVVSGDKMVALFAEKEPLSETGEPGDGLYTFGTAANVARMFRMPDGSVRAFLQGVGRVRLLRITQREPFLKAEVEEALEVVENNTELEAAARNVLGLFQKVVDLAPNLPAEVAAAAANVPEPGMLADFVAAHINLKAAERQQVLEALVVSQRIHLITSLLNREIDILEIGSKIQSQMKEQVDKAQREFYLREQLKAIQKELGETDERDVELNELRLRLKEAQLPEEAMKEADRELDRLSRMPQAAAEYSVARTYLDWLADLPWARTTQDSLDIAQARRILDEDHYDLEKVKERILEYLAVSKAKGGMKGPILCFVGPPGTGKTSVGMSIARALGRKFIRLSLGGIRDEAEVRGHRRTYVGALPGRIIQGIRRAGTRNPVFMLDEIDKIGMDFRGDPSAALLEVLDPQQNNAFSDHYLDVAFDLSQVMFITTANMTDTIPPALLDRMEMLELPGYTEEEKLHIARRYLLPRQLSENGVPADKLDLPDDTVRGVIARYTREAGVRNLEREIGTVCRKVARRLAEGESGPYTVSPDDLATYLGPTRFRSETAEASDEVGVATGLAWTPVGGEILHVEATIVPGRGNLILTGKLGDVMQESAKAALTYARSRAESLGAPKDFYEKYDIHVHLPAGAIPKDGPSAGITMTTALVSALTKRPVRREVGMTGEVTLRGKVLPIGGLKDKVLAAHRAGLKRIIMPKDNEKDLPEIPEQVRRELHFVLVDHMDQVLQEALRDHVAPAQAEAAS